MISLFNISYFTKRRFYGVLLLLEISSFAGAQKQLDSLGFINFYKHIVYTLANDSFKGRTVGSVEEKKAAEFIVKQWKLIKGFKPKLHPFNFRTNDTTAFILTQNVYCFINNKADSTVIISAHYEHVGLGGNLSLTFSKKNQIHNGADDNASGVALLLALSKTFKQWQSKKVNYLFVAYSAHEVGLYGSLAFSDFIAYSFPPICRVYNFDMVGRLDDSSPTLSIYGLNTCSANEVQRIKQLKLPIKLNRSFDYKTVWNTDCRVFVKQNKTCFSFTTGTHDDYHKPSDDPETLNYPGILTIQRILEAHFLK